MIILSIIFMLVLKEHSEIHDLPDINRVLLVEITKCLLC